MNMKIHRRNILLETISPGPNASFFFRENKIPCFPFNWHHHPELELTMIVRGQGLRFVGDSVQNYEDGDVCLLGSHMPHTWLSDLVKGQSVHAIVVQFLPEFMGKHFLAMPETRRIVSLFERARHGLVLSGGMRKRIGAQMMAMPKEFPGSFSQLCLLLSILNEIEKSSSSSFSSSSSSASSAEVQPLAVSDFEPTLSKQASRTINAVCGMMSGRLDEIPTQAEAAQTANLSPQAFSRFFKRCVGRTYVEYVNHLRIGAACRELIETDQSITRIAFDAGFNNLSNFNRRFQDIKGITPREFRRLSRDSHS
jgi:AraC-like DNA-binding protein